MALIILRQIRDSPGTTTACLPATSTPWGNGALDPETCALAHVAE
jgi:hypothetical protein